LSGIVFSFNNNGHLAPRLSCGRTQSSSTRGVDIRRWLRSSVGPGLLLFVASGAVSPALAQGTPQAERSNIGPVIVSPPQRKPINTAAAGTQRARTPARVAGRPRAPAVAVPAVTDGRQAAQTPLNTNVVTEVGSRLGLTVRQTPATVEVIDKQVIEDRGLRTTTDLAKGAVGVLGGDAPGAPAIFSMRGFAGDQINTLYNDIWIGPSTMTGRPMDTGVVFVSRGIACCACGKRARHSQNQDGPGKARVAVSRLA
jgi:hypothetical protein